MLYALAITIAAGLLLIGLLIGATLLVRRVTGAASDAVGPFAGWKWYPSSLGWLLFLALPIASLLLWRVFPVFLFLPFVLPFIWRWRGGRGARSTFLRRHGQRRPPSNGHKADDEHAIEGSYRPLDDE